ncbi:MAG: dual specificity protein phosphatase family protein [Polyangiaceae bacterium]
MDLHLLPLPPDLTTSPGRLGMMSAPGRTRPLPADLDELIGQHGCVALVSLVIDRELEILGIEDLVDRARERDLRVIRFPIDDFSTPDSLEEVESLTTEILALTRTGGTVILHCWAGLGRTGMITACCLASLGFPAKEAIAAVRQCRPGTVQNSLQEDLVARFAEAQVPSIFRTLEEPWRSVTPVIAGRKSASGKEPHCHIGTHHRGARVRVEVHVDPDEHCFREQAMLVGGALFIGAGSGLIFVDLATREVQYLHLDSYFGHLYRLDDGVLAASGRSLHRVGMDGRAQWTAADIACDGVLVHEIRDGVIHGEAEMDPPGGWQPFRLSLDSGR